MSSKSLVLVATFVGACLLAACGKPAETPGAPGPAKAAAAPAAPAGVTKVAVTSTHGAWPTADAPDFGSPKAVAYKDSSVGSASVVVVLANYDFNAANRAEFSKRTSPEKGKARIELWLNRQKTVAPGETLAFVAGLYDATKLQGQAETTSSAEIALPGGTSLQLSQPQGQVEVTGVTAGSITGKLELKDKWTRISGEFSAPLR